MHTAPLQMKQQQAITLPMNSSEFSKWLRLTMQMSYAHHDIKRCYFPSQPKLNLSIRNGQMLIHTASYRHCHEMLNFRPHTVHVHEVHSMHSNKKRVMAVSQCIFLVSFYCTKPFQFCTPAIKCTVYHYR